MGSTGVDGDGFEMFNQRAETIRRRAIFNACSGDFFYGPHSNDSPTIPGLGFQSTRQDADRRKILWLPAPATLQAPRPSRRC